MPLILVLGGTRSGKSLFAENLALRMDDNVAYLATAQSLDLEMEERIKLHQSRRPRHWTTYEEPYNVAGLISKIINNHNVLLLDCLTLLVSNLLLDDLQFDQSNDQLLKEKEELVFRTITEIAQHAENNSCHLIIVSSEVGLGLVPGDLVSRFYRDLIGKCNQLVAQRADRVYMVYAGIPIQIKPDLEIFKD